VAADTGHRLDRGRWRTFAGGRDSIHGHLSPRQGRVINTLRAAPRQEGIKAT
jgi:hypothetical protein